MVVPSAAVEEQQALLHRGEQVLLALVETRGVEVVAREEMLPLDIHLGVVPLFVGEQSVGVGNRGMLMMLMPTRRHRRWCRYDRWLKSLY